MKKREKELAALSADKQIAFAAATAERAFEEGAKFSSQVVKSRKLLRQGLDIAWQVAGGATLDYEKDVKAVHYKIAESLPDMEQPGADEVYLQVGSAVARTLFILQQPDRAARSAVSAANAALGLFSLVYDNPERAENKELEWQDEALKLVKQAKGAIKPELFKAIPDYEREPVYKKFRKAK